MRMFGVVSAAGVLFQISACASLMITLLYITAASLVLDSCVIILPPKTNLKWRSQHEQAEEHYRSAFLIWRSLAISEKTKYPDHPDMAKSLSSLAELRRTRMRYMEAELIQKRALEIWEKVLGSDHPDAAVSLENIAQLYRGTNREKEAAELEKRVERIRAGN